MAGELTRVATDLVVGVEWLQILERRESRLLTQLARGRFLRGAIRAPIHEAAGKCVVPRERRTSPANEQSLEPRRRVIDGEGQHVRRVGERRIVGRLID